MRVGLVVTAGIGTLLVTGGGIAIGRYIVPSSPGSVVAASTTTTASPSDAAACEVINSDFYYPTIPATGEHVSFQQAVQVEALLKEASAPGLTREAGPLQAAINADNETAMVSIIGSLQGGRLRAVGVPTDNLS